MDKIYTKKATRLGKLMNTRSTFSVPIIKVILECFEIVFTETDLDRLILVGEGEYTREQLKTLWKLDDSEFDEYYPYIMSTGALWPRKKDGLYELSPIFPGWIEIFASGPDSEKRRRLITKFSEFENVLKMLNIPPVRAYMNHVNMNYVKDNPGRMSTVVTGTLPASASRGRTIKVGRPIDAENAVMPSGNLYPMLKKHDGHISVMNCFCRMMKRLDGKECDYNMPIEGCVAVGRMSDMLVEYGISKPVSYEEVTGLMDDMERKGCIHTVYHYGITSGEDELIICNCCVDCCFLYSSYREGALSQLLMKAYYKPQLDDETACTGCNRCGHYCPTMATYYDKETRRLVYDADKCVGCGQCVTQCARPVRHMVRDERNVFVKTLSRKEACNA